MGLSDREYMRRPPDEDRLERYERQAQQKEYGPLFQRMRTRKRIAVLLLGLLGLAILLALL